MSNGHSRCKCNFTESKLRYSVARVASFFFGSLGGVSVDLCAFNAAIFAGISPLYANMISSGLAIATTYFFLTRYTFNKHFGAKQFILFFTYYSFSIAAFSLAIDYGVRVTEWSALLCKILTLPASFAVNFIFSNIILDKE
jgi:putative flippase GtrA